MVCQFDACSSPRGAIQPLQERSCSELGEDVSGLLACGGVRMIGAKQRHKVELTAVSYTHLDVYKRQR